MAIGTTPCVLAAAALLAFATPEKADAPANQVAQYNAEVPKTILELQQFRQSSSIHVRTGSGREGVATLVNLNPGVNAWYLLSVAWNDGADEPAWHLENPHPHDARLALDEKSSALVIMEGSARYWCDPFGAKSQPGALDQGRKSSLIYFPLCEGRLYLRNPAKGARTALEAGSEFLRNQVWGGEKVIVLVHHLLEDRYRETAEIEAGKRPAANTAAAGGPVPALVDPEHAGHLVTSTGLGITLEPPGGEKNGMSPGAWYPAAGNPGVYVSILQPDFIAADILRSNPTLANKLDSVEAASLCYLVAFDLDRFELGYASGTQNPEVGWSDRTLPRMKDAKLPGPDGIGTIAPLIATGLIAPDDGKRTVAAFTGGFKRHHGAFSSGDLALKNHGSHYGFIENGVVLSKLQPGVATIFTLDDGSVQMKTWQESDNKLLGRIVHARQNGVPVVEFDDASHSAAPGRLVTKWGPGNWSGSEDEKLRTIRGGAALQISGAQGKRFLIYAVFSDATPSAMARVFQAYRCNYAMLLDMNALEHTYMALYRRSGTELTMEHLLSGMSVLDKSDAGEVIPRFLGYADNRDFFYVMRRNTKEAKR